MIWNHCLRICFALCLCYVNFGMMEKANAGITSEQLASYLPDAPRFWEESGEDRLADASLIDLAFAARSYSRSAQLSPASIPFNVMIYSDQGPEQNLLNEDLTENLLERIFGISNSLDELDLPLDLPGEFIDCTLTQTSDTVSGYPALWIDYDCPIQGLVLLHILVKVEDDFHLGVLIGPSVTDNSVRRFATKIDLDGLARLQP